MTRRGKTQYVRAEDEEQWATIKNKSAWIHEHLNHSTPAALIKQPVAPSLLFDRSDTTFCPNGHSMASDGRSCLGKNCKYAGRG